MKSRNIATATIDGYLKLLRRPADFAVGLLPGHRTGPAATAKVVLDRVDASVRTLAATALGDDGLKLDAERRRAAASEREQAADLRRQVEQADRAEARSRPATRRRPAGASARAPGPCAAPRCDAEAAQPRPARGGERTRARSGQPKLEERRAEQIDAEAAEARLPAVEEEAQALQEREAALDQSDEAKRLGEAAARVKEERKAGAEPGAPV